MSSPLKRRTMSEGSGPNTSTSEKRKDYLSWEDYFMGLAVFTSKRSKDPRTQVGACIVNKDKRIVSLGYNGMPDNFSDEGQHWERELKRNYVCHAEMNAIMNKNASSIKGCTIYTTLFPCKECAKLIIQSGIQSVVYLTDKKKFDESTKPPRSKKDKESYEEDKTKKMFDVVKINHEEFNPKQIIHVIDMSKKA